MVVGVLGKKSEILSQMKTVVLIPSRLNSTRLPNKALLDIGGLPMVVRVMKQASKCVDVHAVFVCTDSSEIAFAVENHGGKVVMTSSSHENGTTRIAEAKEKIDEFDLYVDVQGDEPFIDPDHISEVIQCHRKYKPDIVLPLLPISESKPSHVKAVVDVYGRVMYLSRSDIPFKYKKETPYLKHLSIVSFSPEALERYAQLSMSPLETVEGVELLRAVENGMHVQSTLLDGASFSIDTPEDYEKALNIINEKTI